MLDERELRIRRDWLGALKCPGARRLIGRIIYNAAFSQSHCPGDPLATAYNEGRRSVGLEIMREVEKAKEGETAELLAKTLEEIRDARRNDDDDEPGFER
jgi:hypothetical protein